jgi:hypothetical protein
MPGRFWIRALLCTVFSVRSVYCADLVIEAPTFHVGDTWEFSGTENGKPFSWTREVLEILPDSRLRVRSNRTGKETIAFFDQSMNILINGRIDRPLLRAKYPLANGLSWQYSYKYDNPGGWYRW